MACALPTETDQLHTYRHFCVNLSQAQTQQDALDACQALVELWFAPRIYEFVSYTPPATWKSQHYNPTESELSELHAGNVVLSHTDGRIACLAPLHARNSLIGWFLLLEPNLTEDSLDRLALIAAQAGPTLAFLEASRRHDDRIQQLQTLNEIGRLLSGVLDMPTLLEAIHSATRRLVDTQIFFIALYDENNDEFELAYFAQDDKPLIQPYRWSTKLGLAGVVLRQRRPLLTDNYDNECKRHGVQPSAFIDVSTANAWLGVPLLSRDKALGVMAIGSTRSGYTYKTEHVDLLATIGAQAAIAIENAQLYQRSEKQARQLTTLNQIGRIITSSLDPQRVPLLIMEQIRELLGVEEGSLLLLDDATNELVFAYTIGPFGDRLLGQRLPNGTGLVGYVATHGESVIVNNAPNDPRFYAATDMATGFVTRDILAVPLRGMGGLQGVIEVMNRRDGRQFTEEDQRALEAVADQAVIALENAQRFAQVDQALARRAQELANINDQLQHNLRSLTALNSLGMAINSSLHQPNEIFAMTGYGVIDITDALGACIVRFEQQDFRVVFQIGPAEDFTSQITPLLHRTMESLHPELITSDLPPSLQQIGAQTLFLVPLRATQQVLGVLCVYFPNAGPSLPDQETIVLFATQAAVAIESLQLFAAVHDAHDHMASVLASTREGIMLIEANQRIVIANEALYRLCGLEKENQPIEGMDIEHFIAAWEGTTGYLPAEWNALRKGLVAVATGQQQFASGELNQISTNQPSLEWSALQAQARGDRQGARPNGALLVLRDISEAKASEQLRQDLTNMIVHDLRSPLSSVMASIDMLIRGISGQLNKPQHNILNIAYASSLQMLEMINTLLDISRLEAGRMPLKLHSHTLHPLVDRAIARLESLARDRSMVIQTDLASDLKRVMIDDEMIVRVLQNLIGNALNFSAHGSTVLIRAFNGTRRPYDSNTIPDPSDGFVTVAVSDRGVGIAPKDQAKIFTKFGQVDESRGGSGLGLTFCKLVVETHGGTIWVESALGEGSTFYFTLPVS